MARGTQAKRSRLSVDARREQLLALGLDAFSSTPYDEVSVEAIARAAGISRGLLFHYFPSKREFYLASLRRAAAGLLAATFAAPPGPPIDRLRAGLGAYFDYVDRHGETYTALLRGGIGSDADAQAIVEGTRATIVQRLMAELPPPIGRRDEAERRAALRGWLGLVEAIALDWYDHRDLDRQALIELALRPIPALVSMEI